MATVPNRTPVEYHTTVPAAVLRHAMGWALLGSAILWAGVLAFTGVIGL